MFVEEFTFELHMCNKVVDRYGNEFEVIVEKRNGALCFTHGWSDILG
ncbi:hypothetical protein A2U01_0118915, partial [Trifolium medium]|nr:hypothetical protein [Trifolium medium]